MNSVHRLALLVVALLAFGFKAGAHGPFDSSAQLLVLDDSFEAIATLGLDGAKQVLLNSGLTGAEVNSSLANRGPATAFELSPDIASRFLEITVGDHILKPRSFKVINAGLEVAFTATYTGVPSGPLEVRARYFDGVEAMKPGALLVLDENHNIRSESVLSHYNPKAAVSFGKSNLVVEPAKPVPDITAVSPAAPVSQATPSPSPSPSAAKPWMIWLIIVAVAGLLVWFQKARRGA